MLLLSLLLCWMKRTTSSPYQHSSYAMSPPQVYHNQSGIFTSEPMANLDANNVTTQWYTPTSVCLLFINTHSTLLTVAVRFRQLIPHPTAIIRSRRSLMGPSRTINRSRNTFTSICHPTSHHARTKLPSFRLQRPIAAKE